MLLVFCRGVSTLMGSSSPVLLAPPFVFLAEAFVLVVVAFAIVFSSLLSLVASSEASLVVSSLMLSSLFTAISQQGRRGGE